MAREERQKRSISDISAVPSAHCSSKGSSQKHPSIQILKQDAKIQAKVEPQMQEYNP